MLVIIMVRVDARVGLLVVLQYNTIHYVTDAGVYGLFPFIMVPPGVILW